ncbi:MAG: hypothetical protein LBP59_01535 [Planctomycetaceae bacterium]|nr:hypothetical protein [Planctomycetaceae bacterium]
MFNFQLKNCAGTQPSRQQFAARQTKRLLRSNIDHRRLSTTTSRRDAYVPSDDFL